MDYLLEGGSFTLLVNEPVAKDRLHHFGGVSRGASSKRSKRTPGKSIIQEIADRLWKQMRKVSPGAGDPSSRIRIVDAGDLAAFVRRRRPIEIGERFLSQLGIEEVVELKTVDFWSEDHRVEREWPGFVEDDARRQMLTEIRRALLDGAADPYGRVIWVQGPPGIGKTRALLELFSGEDEASRSLASRARVALSLQAGLVSLERYRVAERFPKLILVVDDCPVEEAKTVTELFARQAQNNGATLVLVIPTGEKQPRRLKMGTPRTFALSPLDPDALTSLVRSEMGGDAAPELVERVRRFSEGYPYYAALIARGVSEDPGAPLSSAADAAKLALASRAACDSESERQNLALDRARCLLAAMLTEHVGWDDDKVFSEEEKAAVCRAVRLESWGRLEDLADQCVARGLLRMRLNRTYKYVTPLVLAREVALMLLSPPDGGPRTPLGPSIRRHASRFAPMFYELLDRLEVGVESDSASTARLAGDILDEVESGTDIGVFEHMPLLGAPLQFAVRRSPGRSAAALRRLVESTPLEVLRERTGLRRDLVWALEAVSRRNASFEDAEASLFRLAVAENETYANNATATWASLFFVELNPTCLSFEERLPFLRRRCAEGSVEERQVGLAGIEAVITADALRFGGAGEGEPRAAPTAEEARRARVQAWGLLMEATLDAPEVAARARKLAIEHLRSGVRFGLGAEVAGMLVAHLSSFDPQSMIEMREQIEHVTLHDRAWIAGSLDIVGAWAQLETSVAPRSFRERLRQRAGTWVAARDDEEDETALVAIAAEAEREPDALLAELDWLESDQAVRAPDFFVALGKQDANGTFLEQLLQRARGGKALNALSWYLRGHQDAGRTRQVDEVLLEMRNEPALLHHRVLSIPRLGATEERMDWLKEDVARGGLPSWILGTLALGSWERTASDNALLALLEALAACGSTAAASVALTLAVRRVKSWKSHPRTWLGLIERLLVRLSDEPLRGHAEYHWSQGAKLLVSMGRVEVVLPLSLRIIARRDGWDGSNRGWEVFLACAKADPGAAWRGLASLLEDGRGRRLLPAFRARELHDAFPAEAVLAWVGREQGRAAIAAELCALHTDHLSPLARGLLTRFGPNSRAAAVLSLKARTTDRMVPSIAAVAERQLRRARHWERDDSDAVRAWAKQLSRRLQEEMEAHGAYEEYEGYVQRRWGT